MVAPVHPRQRRQLHRLPARPRLAADDFRLVPAVDGVRQRIGEGAAPLPTESSMPASAKRSVAQIETSGTSPRSP